MKKSLVAMVGFGMLAVSAKAALVCATPQEMKVLQSAALQQQLTVAALSCHMSADYNRFVAAYRGQLVQSDQALKAFFAARRRGEDYNAYKTRIANEVSLRSLHDARFCASAQKVFDMALGRGEERRGLAPEPPQLINTGYEGCRPVEDRLITAAVAPRPQARPQTKVAIAKPAPRPAMAAVKPMAQPKPTELRAASLPPQPKPVLPKPVLTAEAQRALALAPHVPVPQQRPQWAAAAPKPTARVATIAASKPIAVAAKSYAPQTETVAPKPAPLAKLASAAPLAAMSAPRTVPVVPPRAAPVEPEPPAWDGPSTDEQSSDTFANEPPQRTAAVARSQWRPRDAYRQNGDDDEQIADDHTPNAYRPGATWVNDDGPAARPAAYAPPRRPSPHTYMVLAPDGHWVVVIGRQPRWVRE
jgi:hypothetical protein